MPTTTDMKTYVGHCHCGAYKFTLTRPSLDSYTTCNCSICSRKGYMYIDIPEGSTFKAERGRDKLKRYYFGSGKWAHDFCPTCGVTPLVKELDTDPEHFYVNARVLQDVDFSSLKHEEIDGKAWPGDWKSKDPITPPSAGGERLQTYTGQCHCGAVQYAFNSIPLPEIEVCRCDCSYDIRVGQLTAYIPHTHISLSGLSNTTIYTGVGYGQGKHLLCSTCGCYIGVDTKGLVIPEEQAKYMPPEVLQNLKKFPVNLALLNEELDQKKLKIKEEKNSGNYSVE